MQSLARIESNVMDYRQFEGVKPNDLVTTLETLSGVSLGFPLDVEQVAKMINLKIDTRLDIDQLSRQALLTYREGFVRLWINPIGIQTETEKRWVIARAIGHLILHLDDLRELGELAETSCTLLANPNYFDNKGRDYKASRFASQLLIQKPAVKKQGAEVIAYYRKVVNSNDKVPASIFVKMMAQRFDVPKAVMKERLVALSLIDSNTSI